MLGPLVFVVRQTRNAVLQVLSEDYIRTAHAMGLRRRTVLVHHIVPNAMGPVINTTGLILSVYVISGFLAGLCGFLLTSRLGAAEVVAAQGYELIVIAAVVIGGTSLFGGEGTVLGTIIGAFIISTLTNGLRIMSVPQEWQMVVTGTIVVGAVYLDMLRRSRS